MTDLPTKDSRSSTSALYSSFRRKLKGNRTQTTEPFESEASVATTATTSSEDMALTGETPLTSFDSLSDGKEEADSSEMAVATDTLEQTPPDSTGETTSPNPELEDLPRQRRSKRRMVYTAIKSGIQKSRSLKSSLLTDDKAITTAAAASADDIPAAMVANTDENLPAPPITDSPPPVEASFSDLSLEESTNGTSTSTEDSDSRETSTSTEYPDSTAEPIREPLSKRRMLYNALKGRMSSSRSQTLDSVTEAGPDATPVAADDESADAEAAASLEIQLPPTPAVSAPENEPKQLKYAITPQERNEIEIRSLPEVMEMLATVKDHDITNDIECNFDMENIFARGGYGDIYMGVFKNQQDNGELTEVKVAVKRFRTHIKDNAEKPFVKSFCRETKIWAKLTHTNILTFRGYFIDGPNACLVSDFMENGPSLEYIKRHPEADLEAFLKGSAEALKFCHDKGIIHSDVKSNNILVSPSGQPLLCDFGISFMILSSQTLASTTGVFTGSIPWMSPELLENTTKHTVESDVWAFGMTIYEFLAKEIPYANVHNKVQIPRMITKGIKPIPTSIVPEVQARSRWDSLSEGAKELLSPDVPPFMEPNEIRLWNLCKKCWEKEPKARIPMFSVIDYLDRRYAEKSNVLDRGKRPFDNAEYVASIRDEYVLSDYALEEKIKKKRRDMKVKAAGLAGLAPATLVMGIPGAVGTAVTARRIQISRQKLALLEREWVRRGKTPIP